MLRAPGIVRTQAACNKCPPRPPAPPRRGGQPAQVVCPIKTDISRAAPRPAPPTWPPPGGVKWGHWGCSVRLYSPHRSQDLAPLTPLTSSAHKTLDQYLASLNLTLCGQLQQPLPSLVTLCGHQSPGDCRRGNNPNRAGERHHVKLLLHLRQRVRAGPLLPRQLSVPDVGGVRAQPLPLPHLLGQVPQVQSRRSSARCC